MKLLNEYAADPEILCDAKSVRDLADKVGVPKGRIIARFPKRWFREIYDRLTALDTSFAESQRLQLSLARLEKAVLPTGRPNKSQKETWIDSILDLHKQAPFRAILTNSRAEDGESFLNLDSLDEDNPLWKAEHEYPLARSSDVWIEAIGLLLTACSELMFVDPHFKPSAPRYQRTLQVLCQAAKSNNPRLSITEYHVKKSEDLSAVEFEKECRLKLPARVPNGLELKFFIWSTEHFGQDFHARYILTNHGGVRIEQGLDDNPMAETDTDVSLLGESLYRNRRARFTEGHEDCKFNLAHSFSLIGQR